MSIPPARRSDTDTGEQPARIDQNFATNLRAYREARTLSQEELAQQMTARGFGFSQATIWKIEQGKRPVKISEAAALAQALQVSLWHDLTAEPETFRHQTRLDQANRHAYEAYEQLRATAETYLQRQLELSYVIREARNAGHTVPSMQTTWLDYPPEGTVLEARIEGEQEDENRVRLAETVDKIVDALGERGFDPIFDPDQWVTEGATQGPS